jgi:hypothetical protein
MKKKTRFRLIVLFLILGLSMSFFILLVDWAIFFPELDIKRNFSEPDIGVSTIIAVALFDLEYFFMFPYLFVKKKLSRLGYFKINKSYLFLFYSGNIFGYLPFYEELRKHTKNEICDVSTILNYLDFDYSSKHLNFDSCFCRNPRKFFVYLFVVSCFVVCYCLYLFLKYYLEVRSFSLRGLFVFYYPILHFSAIPYLSSAYRLKKKGYLKTSRLGYHIFFYTGGVFLPLPPYNDVSILPSYKKDNIYSLVELQIMMYESKKNR